MKIPLESPSLDQKEQNGFGHPHKELNGTNKDQNGPFWDVVFHENTSRKSKFRSKGAELFWAPQFYSSNAPIDDLCHHI